MNWIKFLDDMPENGKPIIYTELESNVNNPELINIGNVNLDEEDDEDEILVLYDEVGSRDIPMHGCWIYVSDVIRNIQ